MFNTDQKKHDILKQYATKYIEECNDTRNISDKTLQKAFRNCAVIPPKEWYTAIKQAIYMLIRYQAYIYGEDKLDPRD